MAGAKSNKTREGRAGKWRNICPYQSQVSVKDFPVCHCNCETKRSQETELPHGFTGNSVGRAESLFLIKEALQQLKPQDTVWALKRCVRDPHKYQSASFYSLLIKIYPTEIVLSFFFYFSSRYIHKFPPPHKSKFTPGIPLFFFPSNWGKCLNSPLSILASDSKNCCFNLGMWIWNNLREKLRKDLAAQGHKIWRTHPNSNVSRLNRIVDSRNSWNKKL